MRAVVFTTGTPDTVKLVQSFTHLNADTKVVQYDVPGVSVAQVMEAERPAVGIYIGAIAKYHNPWVPSTDELCRANRAGPMVHVCSDAADDPWWPLLEEYHAAGAFRLQVAIDGCHDCPIGRFGAVELTPVDPAYFLAGVPWESRIHACGFVGGVGHRTAVLDRLRDEGLLERVGGGGQEVRYEYLCAYYTLCRTVVNDARTGSGRRRHVKGRFVEAALGGAVVIESSDSPARDWFRPGWDFLCWRTPDDAVRHVRAEASASKRYEAMARRLRSKVAERHTAAEFWQRVMRRAGI